MIARTLATKYKIFLFDFDGVILESNLVRISGFRNVLSNYPEHKVDKLIEYHNQNGGLSRYVKFKFFYEKILNKNISEKQILHYANLFREIMLKELTKKSYLIPEVISYLEYLKDNHRIIHIVSGSDEVELNIICSKLGIKHFFSTIKGSPTHKNILVKEIISNSNLITNTCLIGDSINDLEAAKLNNIDFYGYNNPKLKSCNEMCQYIENFDI